MYNDTSDGDNSNKKWVATGNGKKWVEKMLQYNNDGEAATISYNAYNVY